MKILTVTFQNNVNYGAILQAHSLTAYLNSHDEVECEVLQYLQKNSNLSWKLFPKPKTYRDVLKNVYMFIRLDLLYYRNKKIKVMREYHSKLLPLTKRQYTSSSIQFDPPKADVYICGSDQIWNFTLIEDPNYFLDFTKKFLNVKRISYAPSIADPWKETRYNAAREYLENIDFISVREFSDIPVVAELSKKKVEHVLDPVFLNSKEYWLNLAEKPKIKSDYILCYFLSVNKTAVDAVKKIKDITGLPIVYINLNALDKFNSDYNIRTANPLEFLGYINGASYVCTNSFHCSAFSIIFKKNYCVIPKSLSNERMISLQSMFKIGNRLFDDVMISNLTIDDLTVDYSQCDQIKVTLVEKSRSFLNRAIFECDLNLEKV